MTAKDRCAVLWITTGYSDIVSSLLSFLCLGPSPTVSESS